MPPQLVVNFIEYPTFRPLGTKTIKAMPHPGDSVYLGLDEGERVVRNVVWYYEEEVDAIIYVKRLDAF